MKSTMKKYIAETLGKTFVDALNYDDNIGFVTFAVETNDVPKFMEEFETFSDDCHSELMIKPSVACDGSFKMTIFITELDTINENCYLISHGVRDCALEAIDTRFFETAKRFVESYGLRVFKSCELLHEGEIASFFIYREPVIQTLINQYEIQRDAVMREALLGKLLGYSAKDCHDFLMNESEDWLNEIPEEHRAEFSNNTEFPRYFNFVGNVTAGWAAEEFIINVDLDKREKEYSVLIESLIPGDYISDGPTTVLLETQDAQEAVEVYNAEIQRLIGQGFEELNPDNEKADTILCRTIDDDAECYWLRIKER